jgi:nucleoid DNA-binding protein
LRGGLEHGPPRCALRMSSDAHGSIMTKSELIEIISAKQKHLPAKDVELAVKQLLEIMSDALATGERIEIRGFGSFSLHFRPPRQGAIRRPARPWRWPASTCRTSSRARTCASASTTARISRSATEPRSGSSKAVLADDRLPLLTWAVVAIAALVIGILAGHFGWGRRWPGSFGKLHPDYLDRPRLSRDRAARPGARHVLEAHGRERRHHRDAFFALGSLYRRRGEVERAIRIHQNLLAREALAPEHREQALLALAQDYLRAGLLDRAEGLFSAGERGAAAARQRARCAARVYERQREWQQALGATGSSRASRRRPPRSWRRTICANWRRWRSSAATSPGARRCCARRAPRPRRFPRAGVLRAQIAERDGRPRARDAAAARRAAEAPELHAGGAAAPAAAGGPERARCVARRNWWRRREARDPAS